MLVFFVFRPKICKQTLILLKNDVKKTKKTQIINNLLLVVQWIAMTSGTANLNHKVCVRRRHYFSTFSVTL